MTVPFGTKCVQSEQFDDPQKVRRNTAGCRETLAKSSTTICCAVVAVGFCTTIQMVTPVEPTINNNNNIRNHNSSHNNHQQ
jgi:hypothetical protein